MNPADETDQAPPPACWLVLNGTVTERSIKLESEIAAALVKPTAAENVAAVSQTEAITLKQNQFAQRRKRKDHNWLSTIIGNEP